MVNVIKMLPRKEMLFRHIDAQYSSTHQWQAAEGVGNFSLKEEGPNYSSFIMSQVHIGCIYQTHAH